MAKRQRITKSEELVASTESQSKEPVKSTEGITVYISNSEHYRNERKRQRECKKLRQEKKK